MCTHSQLLCNRASYLELLELGWVSNREPLGIIAAGLYPLMSFFLIHQSQNIEMNSKHWRQPEKITFGGRRLYLTWRFLKQRMPHPSCRFSDDSRPTYDSVIERIDSRGGICLAVDASGHVQAPAPRRTCRSFRAVCWRLMSARRLNFDWRLTRQRCSTRALSARGSSSLVVSAARHNVHEPSLSLHSQSTTSHRHLP